MATMDSRTDASERDMIDRGMNGQRLPIRIGAISGLLGAIGIIIVVTILLVANGVDLFAAPVLIASVLLGPEPQTVVAVIVGTLIHMATGTALGALFALVMPPIYRVFWIVTGMVYGVGAGLFATYIIMPFFAPDVMAAQTNVGVLLIAHVVYGFVLGIAGGTYGLYWGPKPNAAQ